MKKIKLWGIVLPLLLLMAASCKTRVAEKPIKDALLTVKQSGGANGSAVAYNPDKKLYYIAVAGNTSYPLEVLDEKGNHVYNTQTNFDVRGMWWNPAEKTLEANGYNEDVVKYLLNTNGFPAEKPVNATKTSLQPDQQSVGAYDFKNKHVIYYDNGEIVKVKREDFSMVGRVTLALPVSKEFINSTSIIYTGVKGKEAGVLDYENKKVYLFNITTGKHTHTVSLPDNAVTHSMFRFSFANGHVWLFSEDEREWSGYKLF